MNTEQLQNLLTLKQACSLLNCHANTLRAWEEKGLIKSVRFGVRRDRRFSKSEVLRLLNRNEFGDELNASTLPSDYEVSRIDMTGTQYEGIESDPLMQFSGYAGLDKQIIPSLDINGLLQKQVKTIQYFEDHELSKYPTIEEKILHIITSNRYRNGSLELINLAKYKQQFLAKIQTSIRKQQPITFVMPAFPFKVANPLKSLRGDADLAEVGAFIRFNEIHLQINKLYAPGARFIVFHDGHLYCQHFLHEKADADRYLTSLKKFVSQMGLSKIIQLRDASQEINKIADFDKALAEARKEIENLWKTEKRNNDRVQKIIESAKNNINLSNIPYEVLYRINFSEEWDLSKEDKALKKQINQKAEKCAFEYMVTQHALEKADVFHVRAPNAIRLTVHPKEGQIGIYLVKRKTHLLPWMGVGVLKNNGTISVHYESELLSNGKYYPVFIQGEKFPFFYKEAEVIYQGKEEFQRLFDGIIQNLSKNDFYWAFTFNIEYTDKQVRDILAQVHEGLANKQIEDKAICRDEAHKVVAKTFCKNTNIQIKATSTDIPSGVIILKDRIINLLWSEEPAAFEIKTKEIVERYQQYFSELWNQ